MLAPQVAYGATFEADPETLGPIPDGRFTGCRTENISSRMVSFPVSGLSGAIVDVRVTFTLAGAGQVGHTYVGDLIVTLQGKSRSHTLFGHTGANTFNCGDGSNVAGPYTFADDASSQPFGGWWEAAMATGESEAIPSGTYRTTAKGPFEAGPAPATSMTPVFASVADPNGTWFLKFEDTGSYDEGSVTSAALTITTADGTSPDPPTLTATDPPTGSDQNSPRIIGDAESGSEIKLYLTADCTGAPAATGTAAELASPGIGILVSDNSSNQIRATATDPAMNVSACSAPLAYDEVTPRQTDSADPPPVESPPSDPPTDAAPSDPPSTYPIEINLSYSAKKERFKGRMTSDRFDCVIGARVRIYEKIKGKDPELASADTDRDGTFAVRRRGVGGNFVARTSQRSLADGDACLAGRSNTVTVA